VRIEDRAVVESAETVNGAVTLGQGAEVHGDVGTVNGEITLRSGARVGGGVSNVNGSMELDNATVAGQLETVNADIRIGKGSRVSGGIHVEKNGGHNRSWFGAGNDNPRITIEAGAVVEGPLRFEREVDLYVGHGVALSQVEGVEPKRFTLE
jgi:DUF4097 and DUF4098 domain-containing protein YvlB